VAFPAGKKMFPQYVREAGYYCTNQSKTDYNLKEPGRVWDESSGRAHWRNRKPGQPFFAVFNSTRSHESQIRIRPHTPVHDPAVVRVPAYHPDTPEVRQDWAQYYDQVSAVDADAGRRLRELEDDGLADDTIVFYNADHGPGMPRSKRWPYDSGLHVPLVVYIPEKFKDLRPPDYRPGGKSDRLVSFVDLAPTVLSLAGIKPPDWMQGHAFLGRHQAPPQPYIYGFRGRMDERQDLVRTVTDGRHVYIRNYMPHKIYGQHIDYMFQTPTTRVWKRLHDEGKLTPAQDAFWKTKAPEELYDLEADPDEVNNLATSSAHQAILAKLRRAHRDWESSIRDVGFLPEGEIQSRSRGTLPLRHGPRRRPLSIPPRLRDGRARLDARSGRRAGVDACVARRRQRGALLGRTRAPDAGRRGRGGGPRRADGRARRRVPVCAHRGGGGTRPLRRRVRPRAQPSHAGRPGRLVEERRLRHHGRPQCHRRAGEQGPAPP